MHDPGVERTDTDLRQARTVDRKVRAAERDPATFDGPEGSDVQDAGGGWWHACENPESNESAL
jgi:hypothetical protein